MKKAVYRSVIPLYVVAAAWLLYGLLMPLHTVGNYIMAVLVTVGIGLLARAFCPKVEQAEQAAPEQEKPACDPELARVTDDFRKAIDEMKRLDRSIEDAAVSAQIVRLQELTDKILTQVRQDPKQLPQIRKFMNYYLPTTLKLLNSYDRMSAQGIDGENITATMTQVENLMSTVVIAFERLLDSLFGSEALDISTDVTVLENMLAREGLSDDALHRSIQKDQTDGITLEL